MARFRKNILVSDGAIIRGLVVDSKDIFLRKRFEEKIDYKLAVLTEQFHRNKAVDEEQLKKYVEEFIRDVAVILEKLEDAKRRAEQEESRKIDEIRTLLEKGTRINSERFREKLERFGEHLKANTISALRSNRRGQRRLRRGKAPLGYVLKKLLQDKALDVDVTRRAVRIGEHTLEEHRLISEINYLINALRARPNKETLAQLEERVKLLFEDYKRDLDDFLNIEADIGIKEARKLHRIDHYITFLRMVNSSNNIQKDFKAEINTLIEKLEALKERANVLVKQDSIDANRLIRYAERSIVYGLSILKSATGRQFKTMERELRRYDYRLGHYDVATAIASWGDVLKVIDPPGSSKKGLFLADTMEHEPTRGREFGEFLDDVIGKGWGVTGNSKEEIIKLSRMLLTPFAVTAVKFIA